MSRYSEEVMVEPHYLRILMETCKTQSATARQLGVSSSTVSEALRANSVRKVVELAAQLLVQEEATVSSRKSLSNVLADLRQYFNNRFVTDLTEEDFKVLGSSVKELIRKEK